VGIATRQRADGPHSNPSKDSLSLHSMGTRGCFPGTKVAGA